MLLVRFLQDFAEPLERPLHVLRIRGMSCRVPVLWGLGVSRDLEGTCND